MTIKHAVTFVVMLAGAAPALARSTEPAGAPAIDEARWPGQGLSSVSRASEDEDRKRQSQARAERAAQRQRQQHDRLYDTGMDATYEGQYDRALTVFSRLAEEKGPRTDAALYWKAYAENKLGRRPDALASLGELMKGYPDSRYLKDAKALELEIRNAGGQPMSPAGQDDEDLKLVAIMSMQHSSPEEAVPLLEQVLQGTASPRVKARALFVLALSDSPRARAVLTSIAKGGGPPDLQSRAIQYLGVHGGRESRAALAEVYDASNDIDIKRRILRAYMVAGERDRLLAAAQGEQDPELRSAAVQLLGVMGAHDALWQLYQKETGLDVKRRILQAMFVGGNASRLIEIARTEQDVDLRRTAVRNLGLMGARTTGEAIVGLFGAEKDPAFRKAAIEALFLQGNSAAIVALARKEQDAAMKKHMVERLSLMNDEIARDYMLELLRK